MTTKNEQWLTVREAAALSGFNQEYLRRLIREGKLAHKKISFIYMIDKTSLFDYLDEGKNIDDKRYSPKSKT